LIFKHPRIIYQQQRENFIFADTDGLLANLVICSVPAGAVTTQRDERKKFAPGRMFKPLRAPRARCSSRRRGTLGAFGPM
jgi:hypothetical protein